MGAQVVPVRLDKETLASIDTLVRLGVYESRSQALRELITGGVEKTSDIKEILRAVDRLFAEEKNQGRIPIRLGGATRQLLKERDRFP
ncbi:MAG: ribbon-helix-helix protein, CopG family [Thaumarchaeota archaeon]|nr:ribbon-helix-helix protein, CopG family [Nitrososphaerota archaeon]